MLQLHLPGRHVRTSAEWDPTALGTPISDAEIEHLRAAVREHVDPGRCPVCPATLQAQATQHQDDHTVWAVTCPGCDFHLYLRTFEHHGPPVPAFDNLVGSKPPAHRARRFATQSAGSLTAHAAIIYFVAASMGDGVTPSATTVDTSMVFLTLEQQAEDPDDRDPPDPAETVVTLAAAPPKGFLTMDAPVIMPTDIPPIDLTQRFDPRDYSGVGQEGGVFGGIEGGVGEVPTTVGGLAATYLEAAVDEPPELLTHPPLRYPELLRTAGIEGLVTLEFIVDTTGRAEPRSITVIGSTERTFELPAITMVRGSVFRPGRLRGRRVRVLVSLDVSFTLIRR